MYIHQDDATDEAVETKVEAEVEVDIWRMRYTMA